MRHFLVSFSEHSKIHTFFPLPNDISVINYTYTVIDRFFDKLALPASLSGTLAFTNNGNGSRLIKRRVVFITMMIKAPITSLAFPHKNLVSQFSPKLIRPETVFAGDGRRLPAGRPPVLVTLACERRLSPRSIPQRTPAALHQLHRLSQQGPGGAETLRRAQRCRLHRSLQPPERLRGATAAASAKAAVGVFGRRAPPHQARQEQAAGGAPSSSSCGGRKVEHGGALFRHRGVGLGLAGDRADTRGVRVHTVFSGDRPLLAAPGEAVEEAEGELRRR